MSDFDIVLERLLADPAFRANLAADPARALAGFQLSADETELLQAQVSGDAGGQHQVEQRTSKASLFGLLSPLAGMGQGIGDPIGGAGGASGGMSGMAHGVDLGGPVQAGVEGFSSGATQGFGDAATQGFGDAATQGFGDAATQGFGGAAQDGISAGDDFLNVVDQGQGGGGTGFDQAAGGPLGQNLSDFDFNQQSGLGSSVDNYHTRVDWDGDGKWDEHTYSARSDGGVDIVVDANHDGRADFVGVDHDRDGLIDESYVDTNRDGVLDAHYVDVNRDGWLDKRVPMDRGQGSTYVSRHAAEPEEGIIAAE
jgi:hypothetical protein